MNSFIQWRSWRDALQSSGLADREDLELRRKVATLNVASVLTVFVLLVMAVTALLVSGGLRIGLADLSLALLLLLNLVYLRKTQKYYNAAVTALLSTGLLLYYLFVTGGVKGTGHLWFFVFPLICTTILGSRRGAIATFSLFCAALLFSVLDNFFPFLVTYSFFFKMRFFSAFAVVAAYTYLFERMREQTLGGIKEVNNTLKEKVAALEQTRLALEESEQTYREVVDNASDGIVVVQDFKLQFLNPQMAAMLGYSVEELRGTIFTDNLHPDETEEIISLYQDSLSGEEFKQNFEVLLRHKDGHDVAVELNITRISHQNKVANLVMVRDVSQRKSLEEDQLKALQAAEKANRMKSAFVATMSHELRTPLNHIIGFTDLVRGEACGPVNDQQREFLGDVARSSHHLLSIVNDILDLSRIEAGAMTVVRNEIILTNLLEGALASVRKQAEERQIKLICTIEPNFPEQIWVDAGKLEQVFASLLDNAIKFTPKLGSIEVTACLTARDTTSMAENGTTNDWLELSVQDSGIGIDKEDQENIFSAFQQLDDAANRQFQGTGLGLALTRRLVELQGGFIRVESRGRGYGSRFTVVLPIDNSSSRDR
jgi:PAS domain S-box-containing protein